MSPLQIRKDRIALGPLFDVVRQEMQAPPASTHVFRGGSQPVAIQIGIEDARVHG